MAAQDVKSYGALVEEVAEATGQKKSVVRAILDATQRVAAQHLRKAENNRVHWGRFCTFNSIVTKQRTVNDPRNPGNRLTSEPHMTIRMTPGTHTKEFMTKKRETWESRGEES